MKPVATRLGEINAAGGPSEQAPSEFIERILLHEYGFRLPRRVGADFSQLLQSSEEWRRAGPAPTLVRSFFNTECLTDLGFYAYNSHQVLVGRTAGLIELILKIKYCGQGALLRGSGRDTNEAIVDALTLRFEVECCEACEILSDEVQENVVAAEIVTWAGERLLGIGVSGNRTAASIKAVLVGVNRALGRGRLDNSMPVTEACNPTTSISNGQGQLPAASTPASIIVAGADP